MKVVYQTCCGIDVHKSFLVATIIKTTSGVQPSYQKKRFSTFNNTILQFKEWLLQNHCRDVYMESTGKYWVPEVSDIFGKSATSVIDYLIEQSDNSIDHEEIASRLLRSLTKIPWWLSFPAVCLLPTGSKPYLQKDS